MARKRLFVRELKKLFELRSDMDDPAEIENSIVSGIQLRGTNLWILMFAIFVASIGLNVNSTAVIIGAMLISPLMGPIMGIGYGAGVDNFQVIRDSARALGVFVVLSLITSTLYFTLTPLTQAQSELLARTSPNLWDVLIALFGGMAGIIGITRREWGNVIPGVAIATALMPPLCTAGYGIATGQPRFFFGAFYLFSINAIWIALSALFFTRLMHLPRKTFQLPANQARTRFIISVAVLVTVVPSVFLAVNLVRDELFKTEANAYLASVAKTEPGLFVMQKDIDPATHSITLTVAGKAPDKPTMERLLARLAEHNLGDTRLDVRTFQQDNGADLNVLKSQLQQDLYKNSLQLLESKNARIDELEAQLRDQQALETKQTEREDEFARVRAELHAQYPDIVNVVLARGHFAHPVAEAAPPAEAPPADTAPGSATPAVPPTEDSLVVYIEARRTLDTATRDRIRNWLATHYELKRVYVFSKRVRG